MRTALKYLAVQDDAELSKINHKTAILCNTVSRMYVLQILLYNSVWAGYKYFVSFHISQSFMIHQLHNNYISQEKSSVITVKDPYLRKLSCLRPETWQTQNSNGLPREVHLQDDNSGSWSFWLEYQSSPIVSARSNNDSGNKPN